MCKFTLFVQMDGQLVALLIQNLERLDESVKEESDGVHYTLGNLVYTKI